MERATGSQHGTQMRSCFAPGPGAWSYAYNLLATGQWVPEGNETSYRAVQAAEKVCASQGGLLEQNWEKDLPASRGADQRLVYHPAHCRLMPFNGSTLVETLLAANSSLMLVGDSLMYHTFYWLRCQLQMFSRMECSEKAAAPGLGGFSSGTGTTFSCILGSSHSRLIYYRVNLLQWRGGPAIGTLTYLVNKFSLAKHDVLLLSVGAWYFQQVRNGRDVIRSHLRDELQKASAEWPALIWREPLPSHWPGGQNRCLAQITLHAACSASSSESNNCGALVKRDLYSEFNSSRIHIVNTHDPVLPRSDEHAALHFWYGRSKVDFRHMDCTHYLPRSSVNRFVGTVLFNAVELAVGS